MKTSGRLLTKAALLQVGACSEARRHFSRKFKDQVIVNPKSMRAVAHYEPFDWDWVARRLLSSPGFYAYRIRRRKLQALISNAQIIAKRRRRNVRAMDTQLGEFYQQRIAMLFAQLYMTTEGARLGLEGCYLTVGE